MQFWLVSSLWRRGCESVPTSTMCLVAVISTVYRTSQRASGMFSLAVKSICRVVRTVVGHFLSFHQCRGALVTIIYIIKAAFPSPFSPTPNVKKQQQQQQQARRRRPSQPCVFLTSKFSSAPRGAGLGEMSSRVTSTVTPSSAMFLLSLVRARSTL